ncbi:hypothetical protein GCM10023156_63170 [Novipirellula rosea]|uniref:Uncharacterized protein n=1 Tax=Novipirellula rosea TaxID=1031540 RepID=A0ABP8NS51_9BACT
MLIQGDCEWFPLDEVACVPPILDCGIEAQVNVRIGFRIAFALMPMVVAQDSENVGCGRLRFGKRVDFHFRFTHITVSVTEIRRLTL